MIRFRFLTLAALAMSGGLAQAQLALPGAPGATPAPQQNASAPDAAGEASKPRKADKPATPVPSARRLADRPLALNGNQGQLVFSDRDKTLRIEKLSLAGEVISEPARKCVIDIVGEAPIETKSLGRPDGLARYEAEIPACTFTFDVLDGAVLAPAQETACVFKAADCQATPAGLWGPDPSTLHSDAKAISRQRSRAEAGAERALKAIHTRLKDPAKNDAITHEDADLASRRDEICRGYLDEAVYSFCAARMAEARAALLKARLAALDRKAAKDTPKD